MTEAPMPSMAELGKRLDALTRAQPAAADAAEMLALGEKALEHWVRAKGKQPTRAEREGFRLLGLHRQGADKDPSFNACRETCREIAYHYNLLRLAPGDGQADRRARMMTLLVNHLFLFVTGKMQVEGLGEFCCSSRPLRQDAG